MLSELPACAKPAAPRGQAGRITTPAPHPHPACIPQHCRRFLVKEGVYPYSSGTTGVGQACNASRIDAVDEADRVQLTGGGFRQLQQWSAKTLREVQYGPC